MQECHWRRHWPISPNGGSSGLQPDSLTGPIRASPLVELFISIYHEIKWPHRPIFQSLTASKKNTQHDRRSVGLRETCPTHLNLLKSNVSHRRIHSNQNITNLILEKSVFGCYLTTLQWKINWFNKVIKPPQSFESKYQANWFKGDHNMSRRRHLIRFSHDPMVDKQGTGTLGSNVYPSVSTYGHVCSTTSAVLFLSNAVQPPLNTPCGHTWADIMVTASFLRSFASLKTWKRFLRGAYSFP